MKLRSFLYILSFVFFYNLSLSFFALAQTNILAGNCGIAAVGQDKIAGLCAVEYNPCKNTLTYQGEITEGFCVALPDTPAPTATFRCACIPDCVKNGGKCPANYQCNQQKGICEPTNCEAKGCESVNGFLKRVENAISAYQDLSTKLTNELKELTAIPSGQIVLILPEKQARIDQKKVEIVRVNSNLNLLKDVQTAVSSGGCYFGDLDRKKIFNEECLCSDPAGVLTQGMRDAYDALSSILAAPNIPRI